MITVVNDKIKSVLLKHYRVSAFLSGWLCVAALPPFYQTWGLFITFSLMLWFICNLDNKKQIFKYGYYSGFAFFAFGLSWINNALLLDVEKFWWLVPISFLASGFFFGLFWAIPVWLCGYLKNLITKYIGLATLMVLFEWIRSFLFTGFPWNLLGTTQAYSDVFIQIANIIGTLGISWVVILIASAPALWILGNKKYKIYIPVFVILILSLIYGYGYRCLQKYEYKSSDVVVRLVQPAIPQTIKWKPTALEDNLHKHIKMSQLQANDNLDFVIWGETAFPYSIQYDTYQKNLLKYAISGKTLLITGGIRYNVISYDDYEAFNSMFVVNSKGEILDSYDKTHLVPFGEYIPFRKYLPAFLKPVASQIGSFKKGLGFKPIKINDYPDFGGLICYEVIFPHAIVDNNNRPQWVINLTNDGWYGDSSGPYQHLVAAKLRAVEEGITIVRVAGSGISALIAPTGKIIEQIPLGVSDVLDVKLPQKLSFVTIYSKFGNMLIVIWCFCM